MTDVELLDLGDGGDGGHVSAREAVPGGDFEPESSGALCGLRESRQDLGALATSSMSVFAGV